MISSSENVANLSLFHHIDLLGSSLNGSYREDLFFKMFGQDNAKNIVPAFASLVAILIISSELKRKKIRTMGK